MLKILILGGTNFIGRHLVESLTSQDNFEITLFNRGITNPELYPKIKKIIGDRNTSDINQIFQEKWDYIIDLSCYFPKSLSDIVSHLDKSVQRYIFISTCSVYNNEINQTICRDENAPTLNCSDEEGIDTSNATYGNRKAECERILKKSGLRYSILRPSLIYGPFDSTDRFYYWLYQIKCEKTLLIPNQGTNKFSVTYVKDLVQAILKLVTLNLGSETYNIISFPQLSISELVKTASNLLEKKAKTQNVDSIFLHENNISQWIDIPLWLDCDYYTYDNKKLLTDLKMQTTEFRESVSNTIDYYESLAWYEPKYGMEDKLKNELIEKLRKVNNN
ncbi:MAG: NAD-dependent epimerase/dehydratase family protein [Bacteroidia bacterium]|nr:NAD-dependent epimerase/dehydratase family protein [Bacteroidia bacterium]MCF8447677.1 NAD-dependent epimerase/dehydratase family protein [Bacteroidia bacterium]